MALTDAGRLDEAIAYFKKLHAEHPRKIVYAHELALAYERKGDHQRVVEILEPYLSLPVFGPASYALLGSAYDELGESGKSIALFERAITRYPGAGTLYANAGVTEIGQGRTAQALQYFERGIEHDPRHASNYHHAALIYARSGERVWAAVYAETFMNLERGTRQTREMSALLYRVYRDAVEVGRAANGKVEARVRFSRRAAVDVRPGQKNLQLPFELSYEVAMTPALALGAIHAAERGRPLGVEAIHRARIAFLKIWFSEQHFDRRYPNALFDWQRKLASEGKLEAYDHWLFIAGAPRDVVRWNRAHPGRLAAFLEWFETHPMPIDADSVTGRLRYAAPGRDSALLEQPAEPPRLVAWD